MVKSKNCILCLDRVGDDMKKKTFLPEGLKIECLPQSFISKLQNVRIMNILAFSRIHFKTIEL